MSKALKMSILIVIIALGVLFLGTEVKAVEINSLDELKTLCIDEDVTFNGTTVTLNDDVEINDVIEWSIDEKYVLNLNGHTLKVAEFYVHKGELTIDDTTKVGKIDARFVEILEDATVIVNQCIFETDLVDEFEGEEPFEVRTDIGNGGNLTFKSGSIENTLWNYESGVIVIENGTIANISQFGTATIKNGNFQTLNTDITLAKTELLGGKFSGWVDDGFAVMIQSYEKVDKHTINTLIPEGYAAKFDTFNEEGNMDQNGIPTYTGLYGLSVEVVKAETVYSDLFKKIAPNGVWDFGGLAPKDYVLANEMLTKLVQDVFEPYGYSAYASVLGDEENFNPEKVKVCVYNNEGFEEEHLVSVKYLPENSEKTSIVKPVLNKMKQYKDYSEPSVENAYVLEDLYLINYLFANADEEYLRGDQALNFSKELIDATGGANISFEYVSKMGDGTPNRLYSYSSGEVIVYYEGKPFTTMIAASLGSYVLYIPDTIDINDDEAVIVAATKRIKDYIGKDVKFTIEVAGTLASIEEYNEYTLFDKTKTGDNYYHLKIGEKSYNFAICEKEASKLEQPKYVGNNLASNVVVTSDSTTIPLDTAITVKEVKNDTIRKALDTSVYVAYDISLYSNAKQAKVEKIEDGMFKVSVPVPENLKGKTIMVYHIDDEGEKTEHAAEVEDGIATFETNHFSTYVLAEKKVDTYKVVFDANEGTFKEEKTLTIDKWKIGMEETLEIPTRNGYKFLGFFTEKTGGTKLENYIAEAGIDGNLTFYAQWEEILSEVEPPISEDNSDLNNNDKPIVDNPQTGDNIIFFVGMLFISLIGIIVSIRFRKNLQN